MTMPESDNPALTDALDECVDSILMGESIEACLQRFPALAHELRPLLLAAAAAIQVRPAIDDGVRRANRLRFEGAARHHLAGHAGNDRRGPFARWWNYRIPNLSRAWTAGLAGLALTFALSSGAAYASTDALPDSPLYPVKRVTERARLAITVSDDSRALYHLELIERRTRELASMAEAGRTDQVEQLSREVLKNIEFARVEAGFSPSDTALAASVDPIHVSADTSTGNVGAQGGLGAESTSDSPTLQTARQSSNPTPTFSTGSQPYQMDEKTVAYLKAEGVTASHTNSLLIIAHQQAPDHLKSHVAEALARTEARYRQAQIETGPHVISRTLFAQGIIRINGEVLTLGNSLRFVISHDALGNRPPRDGDLATIGGYVRDDGVLIVLRLYAVDADNISDEEIRLQAESIATLPNELRIPGFSILPAEESGYAPDADSAGRWIYVQGTLTASGAVLGKDIRILDAAPIRFPEW